MISEYKICPLCKRNLLRVDWFYFKKNGAKGMRWESRCKTCCSELSGASSIYYEKSKERHRDWYNKNRDDQLMKARQRQPETYRRRLESGQLKEYSRLQVENITDGYVKSVLACGTNGIIRNKITTELIELKRQHLAVKRAKKLINKALKG